MKLHNSAQDQIASLIAKNMPTEIMDFKFSKKLQNRIQKLEDV
jgi:hypothetical protein